ncbi:MULTISPECIES: antA/AntB antirepressor family protein [Aurantimonas]|uniref:antA/AntB antirepressor family protein n=1 Tax=Aurantimonas TaxID=182269 RepID=UPI003515E35C
MDNDTDSDFPMVAEGQIGDNLVQTVDGRDLHQFLRVGKDFSSWLKDRIDQYGFSENSDFVVFTETGENLRGGRPSKEYAITLDMAKELSMVERNEQGKRARRYFIQCELRAKQGITADDLLGNPRQLLAIAQGYALQIEDMKRDMTVMQADVAVVDRLGRADDWFGVRRSAKMLDMPERKFTDWLQRMGWAFRQNGSRTLLGYSDKQKKGYLKNAPHTYTKQDGSEGVRDQLVFSMAGLIRIAKMLNVTLRAEEAA